ncbi:MAG TPA: zinc ribbon domain-containing protein [Gallionellaceae bacterium]|nr:zinc ribbon domain-containing protein [Gallionellaceae bacterium]
MNAEAQKSENWTWAGRYVSVIVVALILGSAIGGMELFAKTYVISGKLTAAHIVRFLGYSTALSALWMLGQRATMAVQQHGGKWTFLQHLILPVVTLIVVSSVYSVALLILKPLLDLSMTNIYNLVFIAAILACAAWVVMAVLGQSAPLTEAFTSAANRFGAGPVKICTGCNASNDSSAKFCKQCGKALD